MSLAPVTAGGPIDLGTNPSAGKLGLAQTDLNNVSAGMLRVGNASAGGITVSAPVTLTSTNTLSLITGNGISQTAPLSVLNLALQAAAGITLADANNAVTNLAFNNTAGAVQFTNTGSLTIAAVDGLASSANGGTTVEVTPNTPQPTTATVIDTNGNTITGVPLSYTSTDQRTIGVSGTGAITSTFPARNSSCTRLRRSASRPA